MTMGAFDGLIEEIRQAETYREGRVLADKYKKTFADVLKDKK